jgi:transcriptional regulator with XRE-family HTH domain
MDTTTLDKEIGARVAETRDKNGATNAGLAEATGIPRSTLIRSLKGLRPFRVTELARLGDVLGVPYAEFLTAPQPDSVPA